MRIWLLGLVAIVVGTATGLGLTWFEFFEVDEQYGFASSSTAEQGNAAASKGEPRASVVNGAEFDFGSLEHEKSGEHAFVMRNDGTAPLTLTFSGMSCGQCVQTAFVSATLNPTEKREVRVKYVTHKPGPEFYEHVDLSTNDPQNRLIALTIRGYVTRAARVSVEELALGSISGDEETRAKFRLYGYLGDQLEILRHELTNPETASLFQVQYRELERAEFADESRAKRAYEISLTIKPGLPLGPINQTIRLTVKALQSADFEVPVRGTVVSDITLVGSGRLHSDTNDLYLGTVPRAAGIKVPLRVLVKGPYRDSVQLSIGQIDPANVLRAELGKPNKIADGTVHVYPLTIEVAGNAPAVNRLGTDQGKAAKVVIETTHPHAKQVQLSVRFATE